MCHSSIFQRKLCFYRAMHYSAKRGLAIACMSSVCPSVTLVDQDHIGWKSWKLIACTISPTPSLFVAQRPSTYSQGTWGILRRLEVGWGKVVCWSTKAAMSLKRVTIEEKLLWRAYRNSPTLFRTVPPCPTPYGLLFHKLGGSQPPLKIPIAIASGTSKATGLKYGRYIHRVHPNKSPLKILEKTERGTVKFFWVPPIISRTGKAVYKLQILYSHW